MSDRFELERISLILTMRCNLRCRDCCVQAPYYQEKYHPTLEFIKSEIDRLFQIADIIRFFSIEGGEALLRSDFAEILQYLARYQEQVGVEIPVITNGTVIPGPETIQAAAALGDKMRFIVDNYGAVSPHVEEIAALLEKNRIRCTVRNYDDDCYCGGWVDLYGSYEKKRDEAGAEVLHGQCAWVQKLKGVMEIIGGQIYFCPASRVFYERGLAVAEDERIDFMADRSPEELRRQILRLFEKKALAACQYCNGIHDGSARCKPAVQLTQAELERHWLSPETYREAP